MGSSILGSSYSHPGRELPRLPRRRESGRSASVQYPVPPGFTTTVLDRVQALCKADLFALEIFQPVDIVPSAHHRAAAFIYGCRPKEPGPADVGVNVDGG